MTNGNASPAAGLGRRTALVLKVVPADRVFCRWEAEVIGHASATTFPLPARRKSSSIRAEIPLYRKKIAPKGRFSLVSRTIIEFTAQREEAAVGVITWCRTVKIHGFGKNDFCYPYIPAEA